MLQALQKHDKVLHVTTLQKVAIKNVILSGNPVSRYIVISENDPMITQNQFPWYLLPKYMYCKKYEGYKKEKFYFDLTRCIKKKIKRKSRVQRTQNQANWVSKSMGYS